MSSERKKWLEIIILHGQNWMRSECWRTHPEGSEKHQVSQNLIWQCWRGFRAAAVDCHQGCIYPTRHHTQFQFIICIWPNELYLTSALTPASTLLPLWTTFRRRCDFGHQHGKGNKPRCWTSKQNIILQRMWASSSCRPRAAAGKESVKIIIKALARAPWMKWLSCVICWIFSAQCQRKQQLNP